MRIATLLVLALLFTAGCAGEWFPGTKKWLPWTESGQQWRADSAECHAQGSQAEIATVDDPYVREDIRRKAVSDRMGGKGW